MHVKLPHPFSVVLLGLALAAAPVPMHAQILALQGRPVTQEGFAGQKQSLREALLRLRELHQVDIVFDDKLVTRYAVDAGVVSSELALEEKLSRLLNTNGLRFKKTKRDVYLILAPRREKNTGALFSNTGQTTAGQTSPLPAGPENTTAPVTEEPSALTLSGRVTAQDGSGVPGASVSLKGTTLGTATDGEGKFALTVPDGSGTLVISSIGYVTEEIPINNRSTIDVTLVTDIKSLSEVVVVGYGSQQRKDLTGAISSVSAQELKSVPITSVDQALQGRAAGVRVTANTGAPGSAQTVDIRGIGTINSSQPLYVIDGFPVNAISGGPNNNPLATLNPNDIASMEVLKDASATAIYGARGANGVIIITTRRGQSGKPKVTLDAYYGVQSVWRKLDLLNAREYADFANEMQARAKAQFPTNNAYNPIPALQDPNNLRADTDWQDEMFRTAPIQNYTLGVSGGSPNSTYNVSLGYFNQDGILLGTGFKRYSLQINSEYKISKRIKFGQSLNLGRAQTTTGTGGSVAMLVAALPTVPVRNPNNLGGFDGPNKEDTQDARNPVAESTLRKNNNTRYRILGTVYGEYEILDGLTYRLNLGADALLGQQFNFFPKYFAGDLDQSTRSEISETSSVDFSPLIENTLTFQRSFGKHNLTALAGYTQQKFDSRFISGSGRNVPEQGGITVLGAVTSDSKVGGGEFSNSLQSLIGRVNYDFAGKYLVTATVRRDGSSRFNPSNRWGTFPSASVGWRVSEEAFMQGIRAISDLKVRASYGITGNQEFPNYQFLPTLTNVANYVFGGQVVTGVTIKDAFNPNIRWEQTAQTDIGLDLGLFDNRVVLTTDYFIKRTTGMLVQVPLPNSVSFGLGGPFDNSTAIGPFVNNGTVDNRGLEVALTYRKNTGRFTYSFSGNFTTIENELVSLGEGQPRINGVTRTEPGQPIGYFYGWVKEGIFQTKEEVTAKNTKPEMDPVTGQQKVDANGAPVFTPYQPGAQPGDVIFKDIDGDGVITDRDRTRIGSPFPKYTYGFTANAAYANFDLSLMLQGVGGVDIYNGMGVFLTGIYRPYNASSAALNRWTESNPTNDMPRAVSGDPNNNARISDRFVEKGDFMRIKNLTLGYSVPTAGLESWSKGAVSSVRLYATAQNLLTFTKYSGFDPEKGANGEPSVANTQRGIDGGTFPQARVILVGLQLGF